MPIRFKLFVLMSVILFSAIAAVLYKTSDTFFEDKNLFVREFSDRFTGSVARLVSDRVARYQNDVAVLVSNRESLSQVKTPDELSYLIFDRFPTFFVVGVFARGTDGKWAPKWITKNQKSAAKDWPAGYDQTVASSINMDATAEGGVFLTRLSQPSGLPAFGISYLADLTQAQAQDASVTGSAQGEKVILVGVMSNTAFEDIVRDYKGTLTEVAVLDQRGFVYAHPRPQLMGSNLEAHPMVEDYRRSRRDASVGEFVDPDGAAIIGSYQKVKNTNLYVTSSTPMDEAFRAARDLTRQVVVFGLGFVILGLVMAIIFASRITTPIAKLQEIASKIGAGDFTVPVDVKSSDEVGDLAESIAQMKTGLIERDEKLEHSKAALIQSEKMSAFGQLSAGIAHEVKNPLAGILGHAQLAKSKAAGNEDLRKHLDMIEKETRRTKEIIEGLMKFARAEKAELVPTNMYDAVMAGVDLVEHQLNLQGVKIFRKLNPVPLVNANANQLQQVFLNIMMNAGHSMEKSDTKELTVHLDQIEKAVRIRIQDTGSGMPPEVQKRIFEPFFTTKPAGKGTGLGLSVSTGIVRDHHGKMYVESEVGKGTTFFIEIPIPEGNTQIVEPSRVHESVVIPEVAAPKVAPPPPPLAAAESMSDELTPVPVAPPALEAKRIDDDAVITPPSPLQAPPPPPSLSAEVEPLSKPAPKPVPKPVPKPQSPPVANPEASEQTEATVTNVDSKSPVAAAEPKAAPAPATDAAKPAASGDFKVTIRRPKLKA